ncbi:MAG: hypothetical protein ACOC9Y_06625, partial [Chloroflexota bacterium]
REVDGSRLVVPVGDQAAQRLMALERRGDRFIEHHISDVRFVPLRGEFGWDSEAWGEGWKAEWDSQWNG